MSVVQSKVTSKGILKELNNGSAFVDTDEKMDKNKSQQQILDLVIHSCDLSTPTREFDCLREWTYLLFEEFFKQGEHVLQLKPPEDAPVARPALVQVYGCLKYFLGETGPCN